jgi:hypothetical protein
VSFNTEGATAPIGGYLRLFEMESTGAPTFCSGCFIAHPVTSQWLRWSLAEAGMEEILSIEGNGGLIGGVEPAPYIGAGGAERRTLARQLHGGVLRRLLQGSQMTR